MMKPGTRVEVRGFDQLNNERWEAAKIGRWLYQSVDRPDGFQPVTFYADGAKLLIHESRLRVIDNRASTVQSRHGLGKTQVSERY
jgi:hypothetical protein